MRTRRRRPGTATAALAPLPPPWHRYRHFGTATAALAPLPPLWHRYRRPGTAAAAAAAAAAGSCPTPRADALFPTQPRQPEVESALPAADDQRRGPAGVHGRGRLEAEYLPISPHISPYLPISRAPRSGRRTLVTNFALERERGPRAQLRSAVPSSIQPYSDVVSGLRPPPRTHAGLGVLCTRPPSRPPDGMRLPPRLPEIPRDTPRLPEITRDHPRVGCPPWTA